MNEPHRSLPRRALLRGAAFTAAMLVLPWPATAAPARPAADSPEFAAWVMDQIDDMHRGASSHGVLTMRPLDGSGEYTRITYDSLELDVDVPASMFTVQHLKAS